MTSLSQHLGLPPLSPKYEEELAAQVGPLLFARLLMYAESHLNEQERKEVEALIAAEDIEGVVVYLKTQGLPTL